jgi:hypothetical protein
MENDTTIDINLLESEEPRRYLSDACRERLVMTGIATCYLSLFTALIGFLFYGLYKVSQL